MTMKRITAGLVLAAVPIASCGLDSGGIDLPPADDSPVLQLKSEGGFAPVAIILGQGPRYTLLADGRLISEGPVIAIHPGPLVPNYQVTRITDDQMRSVLDIVEELGLPDMVDEVDDTLTSQVADATTEVVTYWDDNGEHKYSVYALGIDPDPKRPETKLFAELLELLAQLASAVDSTPFVATQVQYVVGPGFIDPEFPDLRDWPLQNNDFNGWRTLPNGWQCQVQGGPVPSVFDDATTATQWQHPDPEVGAEPFQILVRPLLPGESNCFDN